MKNILKNILGFSALLFMLVSCKKEVDTTIMQKVAFSSAITPSSTDVVLKEEDEEKVALTITWSKVEYPVVAPVSYLLQFDLPADTLTATPWSKAVAVEVGEDVLTKSFTVKELNDIATSLGLESEKANLIVRVKASMSRDIFSAPTTVAVTPFVPAPPPLPAYPSLWVPGAYQGWDPAAAPRLVSVNSDGVYEGYVNLTAGEFKLTAQAGWEPMAYGDGGNGDLIEANFAGGNFNAPTAGYYFLHANLNTMKYTFIKTSWGVIGDATPTGWDTDTDFIYDPATKKLKVTLNLTNTGSFKFRANDGWSMAMGVKNGKLAYSDNPVYPYDSTVGNLTVSQSGNYTITLDLSVPGNYTYSLKKN